MAMANRFNLGRQKRTMLWVEPSDARQEGNECRRREGNEADCGLDPYFSSKWLIFIRSPLAGFDRSLTSSLSFLAALLNERVGDVNQKHKSLVGSDDQKTSQHTSNNATNNCKHAATHKA